MKQILKKNWDLETIGIVSNDKWKESYITTDFMANNIKFKDGRYEVSLTWRLDREKLDSNFNSVFAQMKNLTRKLLNSGKLQEYVLFGNIFTITFLK